jgi:hypothetical protein
MTSSCDAFLGIHDRVDMNRWCSVHEPDIADQRRHLGLVIQRKVSIGSMLSVEPAEQAALDRSDGGEVSRVASLTVAKAVMPDMISSPLPRVTTWSSANCRTPKS